MENNKVVLINELYHVGKINGMSLKQAKELVDSLKTNKATKFKQDDKGTRCGHTVLVPHIGNTTSILNENLHRYWKMLYTNGTVINGELIDSVEATNQMWYEWSDMNTIKNSIVNSVREVKVSLDDEYKKSVIYALDHYKDMGMSNPIILIDRINVEYYEKYKKVK